MLDILLSFVLSYGWSQCFHLKTTFRTKVFHVLHVFTECKGRIYFAVLLCFLSCKFMCFTNRKGLGFPK